jgi:uncharacterized protein (DUF2384 family)
MPAVLEKPGTFTAAVVDDAGFIDANRLADAVRLSRAELAQILSVKPKSLTDSPTSSKIQASAARFVRMMDEVADFLEERRFALFWLRSPQRELDDQSPLHWLLLGKLVEISDHVERMTSGQPD